MAEEVVETNTDVEQKEEIPTESKEETGNEKEDEEKNNDDEIDPIIAPEEDEAMKKRLERFGPIEETTNSNAKITKPTESTGEIDLDALIKKNRNQRKRKRQPQKRKPSENKKSEEPPKKAVSK